MDYRQIIQNKIFSAEYLKRKVSIWKSENKRIVFTNGCFDIIHPGHVQYLAEAAALGDFLIIGVNSDNSVKKLKGEKRPIIPERERCLILASLVFVDAICLFDKDTPLELIKMLIPDVLVKGKDYKAEQIVGYDVVIQNGGKVETIDLVDGFSTTAMIDRMKNI